jgi:ABC-2 type transport system permease protein
VSGWRQMLLVARRDFVQRATSRPFLLTMVLVIGLVVVAGPFLAQLGRADPERTVGVVGEPSGAFEDALAAAAEQVELEPTVQAFPDRDAADAAVEAGDVDVAVVLEPSPGTLVWASGVDPRLGTVLLAALRADAQSQRVAELGLSPADLQSLVAVPPPDDLVLEPSDPADSAEQAAVFVGMLLLYLSVVLFGQFVMLGVVEEKSSRVVEVILSRVRPYHLLAGKVLGIGALAVVQIVVLAVLLFVMATRVLFPDQRIDLGVGLIASIVGWFLVGFAFYAVVYAALGSTVTRQEDMQGVAMLPLAFILPGYFIALFSTDDPNGPLAVAASLLPPTSPFVMPVRAAATEVPSWQVLLSVVLLLAATYGVIRLAGRIYTGAILSIGQKVSLRQAWRSSSHLPT